MTRLAHLDVLIARAEKYLSTNDPRTDEARHLIHTLLRYVPDSQQECPKCQAGRLYLVCSYAGCDYTRESLIQLRREP